MPNYIYVSLQDEDKVSDFQVGQRDRQTDSPGSIAASGRAFCDGDESRPEGTVRCPIVTCRGYRATRLTPIQER